ncbi:MAG: triose-phosphate isomerase [Candidatus Margulisiibacteriota bacterium]
MGIEARIPMIIGNWKMHKGTIPETSELLRGLIPLVRDVADREIVVCPPFTTLESATYLCKDANISIGAQNLHWEEKGAFTGEISAPMLLGLGVTHVIIGHSERRQLFGELYELVNRKIDSALQFNLAPIVCVGENLDEYRAEQTFRVVEKQIECGLKGLSDIQMREIVIAYEPIWAIGTGLAATSFRAEMVHSFIRARLAETFSPEVGNSIRILYGGSVKPDNISEFMLQPDIDGVLVGGASLEADVFAKIVMGKPFYR